jgi:hypothetical protein
VQRLRLIFSEACGELRGKAAARKRVSLRHCDREISRRPATPDILSDKMDSKFSQ